MFHCCVTEFITCIHHIGCGASTLINNLTSASVSSAYNTTTSAGNSSPSSQLWGGILALRQRLQTLPTPLLAAFNCVCDYCHMIDADGEDHSTRVIFIERLHHTCISQSICREKLPIDPEALPASVYSWPKDLPKPALVIYMVLSHEEREQRTGQVSIPLAEYNRMQVSLYR